MSLQILPNDRAEYFTATGGETVFPYNFPLLAAADLQVLRTRANVVTSLAEGTDYTLAGIGDQAGGTVTLTAALLAGDRLALVGNQAIARSTNFLDSGDFRAAALNAEFQRLTIALQELDTLQQRGVTLALADPSAQLILPLATERAGRVFGFDSGGNVQLLTITGGTVTAYAQWAGTAGGTANARTLAPLPAIGAYAAGQAFEFVNGAAANTGAATLAVSGLAAQALLRPDGSPLIAGDLPANTLVTVRYDGTSFRVANLLIAVGAATEASAGVVEIASAAEADAGSDNTRAMSPQRVRRERRATLNQGSAYTAVLDDNGRLVRATGTWTLGLTAAATLGNGWCLRVRNVGTGTITLDPNAAELIDGVATLELPPGASGLVVCDGGAFHTVGLVAERVYASGAQSMTAGGLLTLPHGLGAAPAIGDISTALECVTAQANWLVGEFMQMGSGSRTDWGGAAHAGYVIWADATNIYVRFHLTNVALLFDKATGGAAFATAANWRLHVRATRRFP